LKRTILTVIVVSALLLTAFLEGSAAGMALRLVPSVTLREEANDNVFISPDNRQGAFISTISPEIDVAVASERLDASLALRLDGIVYAGIARLDSLDQSYRGMVRYRQNERLTLSSQAQFVRDSRPDRDLETTGMATSSVKRDRQNYSLAADYLFTETATMSMSYAYSQDDYVSRSFSDLSTHSATFGLSHDLGRLWSSAKALASFGFSRYLFASSTVDNYSATAGVSRDFNEKWTLLVMAGGRHTRSETYSPGETTDSSGWGWVGRASLSYRGERSSGSLSYLNDVAPATGRISSGATRRNSLTAIVQHRFTPELSGNLSFGYYMNKSVKGGSAGTDIGQDTVSVSSGIRYEFNRDLALDASYRYTRIYYSTTDRNADRNLFSVRLVFRSPVEF
jgi:opacity protein-like surface antigen